MSEYKTVFCPKGNLKKDVDKFINKQSYQNFRNKSSADKAPKKQDVKENEKKSENKTESKAVTAPNTPNEFYNPFTGIGTEDKQAENIRIPILTPGRSERTVMNMLREHIKRFTDEYMDFLRLSNLYNEIYKEIRTGVVTKKEDIFFINGKTITEYMDRISDYAADKSWFLQGKDFSLSAIKENLYHSWNRIVQKN